MEIKKKIAINFSFFKKKEENLYLDRTETEITSKKKLLDDYKNSNKKIKFEAVNKKPIKFAENTLYIRVDGKMGWMFVIENE